MRLTAAEDSSRTLQAKIKDVDGENRQLQEVMNITDQGKLEEAKCVQRMAAWTRDAHAKLRDSEVGYNHL